MTKKEELTSHPLDATTTKPNRIAHVLPNLPTRQEMDANSPKRPIPRMPQRT